MLPEYVSVAAMPPRFTLATFTGTATCRWPPGAPWPLGLFCAGGAPVPRQPAISGTASNRAPNLIDVDGRDIRDSLSTQQCAGIGARWAGTGATGEIDGQRSRRHPLGRLLADRVGK